MFILFSDNSSNETSSENAETKKNTTDSKQSTNQSSSKYEYKSIKKRKNDWDDYKKIENDLLIKNHDFWGMEYNKQREFENDQRNIFQADLQNNMNMFLQQIPNILNQQHILPPVINQNTSYQVPNTFKHSQFIHQNHFASQETPQGARQGESFTTPERFPYKYESFYSNEPKNIVKDEGERKTAVLLQGRHQTNPTRMVQIPVALPKTQTIPRTQSQKYEPTKQKNIIIASFQPSNSIGNLRPVYSPHTSIRPISNQMEIKLPTSDQPKNLMNTSQMIAFDSFEEYIEEITDD